MSFFKKITLKSLSTELKMMEESRILDNIRNYRNVSVVNHFGAVSIYQKSLLEGKFPKDKFLHLFDADRILFIEKPLDIKDFDFCINAKNNSVTIEFSAWTIDRPLDWFLETNIDRTDPVVIKYLKCVQLELNRVNRMKENLDKLYSQITDDEKLLAEVYDLD